MKRPIWRLFYWEGRATRREYCVVLLIGVAIFAATFGWRAWLGFHGAVPDALYLLGALLMLPAGALVQFGVCRRLHDLGISEHNAYWTVIFWFGGGFLVERFGAPPLAGGIAGALLFATLVGIPRGNVGDNAYGPDPREEIG
jgi:uncharacterized membrane protein YhaH (DUF805 family)